MSSIVPFDKCHAVICKHIRSGKNLEATEIVLPVSWIMGNNLFKKGSSPAAWVYKNAVFDATEKSPPRHIIAEKGIKQRGSEVLMFFTSLFRNPFFCLMCCSLGQVMKKMYPLPE